MTKRFNVCDRVVLSEAGKEHEFYAKFRDRTLVIESVATAYMPASKFYEQGKPRGFHPGFDSSTNAALYDCKGIHCSLYDWELSEAPVISTKSRIPDCPNCNGQMELNGTGRFICFFC